MDTDIFINNSELRLRYLKYAYNSLIESYKELEAEVRDFSRSNENSIRDELVRRAKKRKSEDLPFRWVTEFPDLDERTRIDIDIVTPYSLIDENYAIKIECKIVGESKYIDTRSSFNSYPPTNGIMSFISGKYASQMDLAGMVGFILDGNLTNKIATVKTRLSKGNFTTQNLQVYSINKCFQYSFESRHIRDTPLPPISIYHLFFDFQYTNSTSC